MSFAENRAMFRPIIETEEGAMMQPRLPEQFQVKKSGLPSELPIISNPSVEVRRSVNRDKPPPGISKKAEDHHADKSKDRLISAKGHSSKPAAKDVSKVNIFHAAKASELAQPSRIVSAITKSPMQKAPTALKDECRTVRPAQGRVDSSKAVVEKKQVAAKRERDREIQMVQALPCESSSSSDTYRPVTKRVEPVLPSKKLIPEIERQDGNVSAMSPEVISKKHKPNPMGISITGLDKPRKSIGGSIEVAEDPKNATRVGADNKEKLTKGDIGVGKVFEFEGNEEGDNMAVNLPQKQWLPSLHLTKPSQEGPQEAFSFMSQHPHKKVSSPDNRLKPAIKSPLLPPKDISGMKTDTSAGTLFPFDFEYDDMDPESLA